ncbi:MAG: tRNA threonylcarbamoyladenosine dehydratase [Deltaproteobacteria bacterium]|nr:tRNA threonylcarbamoyladenosine dehydratase [Deltaproteobacteria bacterium]
MTGESFARTSLLLGPEALARIERAFVVVVGLGAVGSFAVEALARAGVGRLRLVDFDTVRASDLNRQILALRSTLGRPKVEVAAQRVADIHPACRVEPLGLFAHADTASRILEGPPDVLVDCIDAVGPKVALLLAAVRAQVAAVSSMGAALRRDPGLVRTGDLSETRICPLAHAVRKRLHREGVREGIRCVYSLERPADAVRPGDCGEQGLERGRTRTRLGSLPTIPGIFGLAAAGSALELLACLPPGFSRG